MNDETARALLKHAASWGFILGPKQIAQRVSQKIRAKRLGKPEHSGITRRKDVEAAEILSTTEPVPKAELPSLLKAHRREKGFIRKMKTEHPETWSETEKSIRGFIRKKSSLVREFLKQSGRLYS